MAKSKKAKSPPKLPDPAQDLLKAIATAYHSDPESLFRSRLSVEMAMQAFLTIRDKQFELVPLDLNESQRRLLEVVFAQREAGKPVRVIVWKGRQQGLSTVVAAYNFLSLLCKPRSALVITEEKGGSAQNLWNMYDTYHKNLPFPLEQDATRLGHHRSFVTGASIRVEGEKKVSSFTHQLVHLSEAPFFQDLNGTLNMVLQTVPRSVDSAVFLESANNEFGAGSQSDWQELWNNAEGGYSDFHALFIPWFAHEEYREAFKSREDRQAFREELRDREDDVFGDEVQYMQTYACNGLTLEAMKWRRWMIRNNCNSSKGRFLEQYPFCAEDAQIAMGNRVFSFPVLKTYQQYTRPPELVGFFHETTDKQVQFEEDRYGCAHLWGTPKPFFEYVAGSDHAEGLESGDFNCAYVGSRLPLEIVARLRGRDDHRLSAYEFAKQLWYMLRYYNDATACPESNLDGGTVISYLRDTYHYGNLTDEISLGFGGHTPRQGWRNTGLTRKRGVEMTVEAINEEQIMVPDEELIQEMFYFIRSKGKPEAEKKGKLRKPGESELGFYDDRIFALIGLLFAHEGLGLPRAPSRLEQERARHPSRQRRWDAPQRHGNVLDYV